MNFNLPLLPSLAAKRIAVHVTPAAARIMRSAHPWLFDQGIQRQSHQGQPGDLAVVFDQQRRFLGVGLYDPDSPIRVKILQHGQQAVINSEWFAAAIDRAIRRRDPLLTAQTTAVRLIHGENDGLPGLVLDRYAQTGVLKLYSLAWLPHLPQVLAGIVAAGPWERLVLRLSRNMQAGAALYGLADGHILGGLPLDGPVLFQENGLTFTADVRQGHKTGFFLDQRDNRAKVGALAGGRTVLDVFAYNGGFSLYAAQGGAREVTSLDVSGPALAMARHHFQLNEGIAEVAAATHHLLQGDAFLTLADLAGTGRQYDLIIIDPPALAKKQSEIPRAVNAYSRLVRLGLAVLAPGGTLVISSCSSRVTAETFFTLVHETASQEGRPLQELERTGHAPDHPISFPEGAYLKCLFARV
ncbi:MAG: class I SAM-dependent rRNA methyltransferase [Anaerolineae bacterium]|nr:class I SAM-dependent rRNA methyltransferase [Anaerolineae bacterium]